MADEQVALLGLSYIRIHLINIPCILLLYAYAAKLTARLTLKRLWVAMAFSTKMSLSSVSTHAQQSSTTEAVALFRRRALMRTACANGLGGGNQCRKRGEAG